MAHKMVSVREAHIEDISKISFVLATSWKTAYRGIVNDDYLDALANNHWEDFLSKGLKGGAIFAMALLENEEIVGASILGKSEKEGNINMISLYLLPNKIGQGLGKYFYHEIEKEMQRRGFTKCMLDVLENNIVAIDFYQSQGFVDANIKGTTTLGAQDYAYKMFEKNIAL